VAVEDVVAEDERARPLAHEVAPDEERLREALGLRLHRVRELDAPVAAVAEQLLKRGVSCGVEMSRISRMPASMSVVSG
jgi:hypothetical protein